MSFPNDTAKSLYALSVANRDTLIANSDGSWFVSSESTPGDMHLVDGTGCTCVGWRLRHTCRHVVRVAAELLALETEGVPIDDIA